jgi:hypothetical protein
VVARPPKPAVAAITTPQRPQPHTAAPGPAPHPVAAARPVATAHPAPARPKAPPKDEHH